MEEIWNAEEIGMGVITCDLEAGEERRPAEESRWREGEREPLSRLNFGL